MWLTGIQGLQVLAAVVAGLFAVAGAVVVFELLVGLVRGVVAMAAMVGRFLACRNRAPETEGRVVRDPRPPASGRSLIPMSDPGLFARQAWWRLRC